MPPGLATYQICGCSLRQTEAIIRMLTGAHFAGSTALLDDRIFSPNPIIPNGAAPRGQQIATKLHVEWRLCDNHWHALRQASLMKGGGGGWPSQKSPHYYHTCILQESSTLFVSCSWERCIYISRVLRSTELKSQTCQVAHTPDQL